MRTKLTAAHIIAHQDGGHRHRRDGEIVWDGNEIIDVGRAFPGAMDETIAAPGEW